MDKDKYMFSQIKTTEVASSSVMKISDLFLVLYIFVVVKIVIYIHMYV